MSMMEDMLAKSGIFTGDRFISKGRLKSFNNDIDELDKFLSPEFLLKQALIRKSRIKLEIKINENNGKAT